MVEYGLEWNDFVLEIPVEVIIVPIFGGFEIKVTFDYDLFKKRNDFDSECDEWAYEKEKEFLTEIIPDAQKQYLETISDFLKGYKIENLKKSA